MENKVCAIIVTYNRLDLLMGAIESLRSQTFQPDILVVNNDSTDGTKEYLENNKGIIVINQDNSGGAGGFFTGIKFACENGYDFAWVMDDDVVAKNDALEQLLNGYDYLTAHGERVGFLCSTVTNADGYTVNNPVVDDERLNPTFHPSWNKYLEKGMVGVKTATFVSVLIPCAVTKELGLPFKEFFIWGDDTEYTKRISNKYNSFLIGSSTVKHLRVGDKPIRLVELTDKRRIRMYQNAIRNSVFLHRKKVYNIKQTIIFSIWQIVVLCRLIKTGSFYKIKIWFGGIWKGMFFNPTIKYPDLL